jgi:hypothetical protein
MYIFFLETSSLFLGFIHIFIPVLAIYILCYILYDVRILLSDLAELE